MHQTSSVFAVNGQIFSETKATMQTPVIVIETTLVNHRTDMPNELVGQL